MKIDNGRKITRCHFSKPPTRRKETRLAWIGKPSESVESALVRLSRVIHISSISPRNERQRGKKALTNVVRASYFKHCHLYVLDRGNEVTMTSTIPSFSLPPPLVIMILNRSSPRIVRRNRRVIWATHSCTVRTIAGCEQLNHLLQLHILQFDYF